MSARVSSGRPPKGPVPVLRMFDEPSARALHVDYLGFALDREHRFDEAAPSYLQQLSREETDSLRRHSITIGR